MRRKFFVIITLTIGICLGAGIYFLVPQPVQAISKKAKVNKPSFTKVRILKKTCVRKIHWKIPRYRSTVGPKRYVSRNDIVRIKQTGFNFGWYMKVPGHRGLYTIVKGLNDYSWFTLKTKIPKPKRYKEGWHGCTYQSSNGTKLKIKNLKRCTVFNYDNATSKPDETDLVLTMTLKNNGHKNIKPSKWLNDNINIYPEESSEDHLLLDFTDEQLITEDDDYYDIFKERDDKLSKNDYTTFAVILDGDEADTHANRYIFSDFYGHKISIPVENEKVSVDVED